MRKFLVVLENYVNGCVKCVLKYLPEEIIYLFATKCITCKNKGNFSSIKALAIVV
ncbi:hypothetical protein FQR65_LT06542 [Abscondita terminalis]|nr:hypothetical protein FQR65_LT06542 [Abscondita terminalis]